MSVFIWIFYLVIGFAQLFAISDGIQHATGLGLLVSLIISAITTYIPLLGPGLGVYGAINVWGWPAVQAILLFFWFVPVAIIFLIFNRG